MKKKGKAKWIRICQKSPEKKWDKVTAAAIALDCWDEIKKHHILKAWDIKTDYQSSDSEGSDSDSEFFPSQRNTK